MQLRVRWALASLLAGAASANAADVIVQPSAGSSFIVQDASGTVYRLQVLESGSVTVTGPTSNTALVVTQPAGGSADALTVSQGGQGRGMGVVMPSGSGARGVDVTHGGTGPGVFASTAGNAIWGITSTISSAAVIGDATDGEVVVGRGNRGGSGVGAVVGRQDGQGGYGVRGFVTYANAPISPTGSPSIGVLGQAGISGGTNSLGGRFENVNAANAAHVLEAAGNGTGTTLWVSNTNAGAINLAEFSKSGTTVARIDATGKGYFNGGTQTGGADVAERFSTRDQLEPGDVIEIDALAEAHYRRATDRESTLVAGVVTTFPGVLMNAPDASGAASGPALALVGRVPVKVTNEGGAIAPGDLLVTSSTPGHAMRAPAQVKPGTVIGKALGAFAGPSGRVQMLVMLR